LHRARRAAIDGHVSRPRNDLERHYAMAAGLRTRE
jgi:hypothetical protein